MSEEIYVFLFFVFWFWYHKIHHIVCMFASLRQFFRVCVLEYVLVCLIWARYREKTQHHGWHIKWTWERVDDVADLKIKSKYFEVCVGVWTKKYRAVEHRSTKTLGVGGFSLRITAKTACYSQSTMALVDRYEHGHRNSTSVRISHSCVYKLQLCRGHPIPELQSFQVEDRF